MSLLHFNGSIKRISKQRIMSILGHSRQIEYLDKVLKRGRISHAYFFYGPAHVGKFTVAKLFAQKLGSIDPIILDTKHTLVSKKDQRKDIPIEDIRELKRRLSLASTKDEWRVSIINEAENLSEEATNSFLKLLEEPGENTLFLLISESPELLPPTIVSRCHPIRFSLVPDNLMEPHLKNRIKDELVRKEILLLAAGRPGVAFELAEDKDLFEKEQKFRKMFSAALSGEAHDIFSFTGKIYGDAGLRRKSAEYLIGHLREKMLGNVSREEDFVNRIKKVHEIYTVLETTNVNPRLALDVMFLEGRS